MTEHPWTILVAERGISWGDSRLPIRFWERVIPEPMSGCWLWVGRTLRAYGRFDNGRDQQAHRVSYTALVGPIASGLTVDHLCNVPCCQNPAHMELVTAEENTRRRSARITICPNGHHRIGECIECRRARSRRYKARRADAAMMAVSS